MNLQINDYAEIKIQHQAVSTPTPRCLTEITNDAGAVKLSLTDLKTGKIGQLSQPLKLHVTDYSLDETCPLTDFITSEFMRYDSDVIFAEAMPLAYTAPTGFHSFKALFSVFPFGYSVHLKAIKMGEAQFQVLKLQDQLAAQLNRGNTDGLLYDVRAQKESDSISLGQGFITLK